MKYLEEIANKSIYIIREVKAKFNNPIVLWSTGKDSTTMLYLIRAAFFNKIPFPVVFIETGYQFKETYTFRDKLAKQLDLDLIIIKNNEVNPYENSKLECCHIHKTLALKQLLEKEHYDSIIVSIRRDEHYMRNIERYFSPRDKDFRYHFIKVTNKEDQDIESLQNTELSGWNIYFANYINANHLRIHPLLHWYEIDIWKYIRANKIPVNPLYFKGYRSIGCYPCTRPVWSPVKSINEIIHRLRYTNIPERAGRDQDKEMLMRRLRALGYM